MLTQDSWTLCTLEGSSSVMGGMMVGVAVEEGGQLDWRNMHEVSADVT